MECVYTHVQNSSEFFIRRLNHFSSTPDAMGEYEKIKCITLPLEDDDNRLLLGITEVETDHIPIINNVLKLLQHSS
jgi:hypothetical protein